MSKVATIIAFKSSDLQGLTGVVPIPEDFNPPVWAGPRDLLEDDQSFRQLLPYVLVKTPKGYVTYIRNTTGGEERLHNLGSIGIGGHVDAIDSVYDDNNRVDLWKTIVNSAKREIEEEIGLQVANEEELKPLGLIISDATEVDKVHIAYVLYWEVANDQEMKFEDHLSNVRILTKEELLSEDKDLTLESWSQQLLPILP